MGTRSAIVMHNGRHQDYRSVYCHWDGYPEYNGVILMEHYTDPEKVGELISLGNLSSLGPEIGTKHDFNKRNEDECTFYGRDRGEPATEASKFDTLDEVLNYYKHSDVEFVYLFHPNDYDDWACYDIKQNRYVDLYFLIDQKGKEPA